MNACQRKRTSACVMIWRAFRVIDVVLLPVCERALLGLFLGLHVGVDVLHVVKFFKTLYHLVDGGTLVAAQVLQVVGHIGELAADVLEALLLKELLDLCILLHVVAVDGDGAFLVVDVILVLNAEVDKLQDKVVHVDAVFLLEGEHTLVVEEVRQRACCAQGAAKLVEHRAHVAYGAGGVVGEGVDEDGDAVGAVALVCHFFIFALVLAHGVLDGTLDVVFRHVLALACGYY